MSIELKQLLQREADAILNIPIEESFDNAIDLIYNTVHKKKGKLIACGMGKAGQIAINIATTFSSTGTPAVFLHPSDAQHGDMGVVRENDVLLLISNSGKTREILELIMLVNNLHPEVKIIGITGNTASPLGKEADIILSTGLPKEICPLELTPTTSTTCMTVLGDIMVVSLMKKIGFTTHDYSLRHHGGYLGEKSRNAIK